MYLNLWNPFPFIYLKPEKRYPFRAEPPRIGHYREYPPGRPLGIACSKCHLSNSLIIHQVKTENHNSQQWRRFGHLVSIDDFASRVPLFDREDVSNTPHFYGCKKPSNFIKYLHRCASYFDLSSRCLHIPIKHSLVFDLVFHKILCQPWGI